MSAEDYLNAKDTFEDSYPDISLFMNEKKLLEEKKKRNTQKAIDSKKSKLLQKRMKQKAIKSLEKAFDGMNKTSSKVSKTADSILNAFKLIGTIVTGIGIAFVSINKVLDNLSNSDVQSIYGGGEDDTSTPYGQTYGATSLTGIHMSKAGKDRLKLDEGCVLYAYDDKGPIKDGKHIPFMPGDKKRGTLTIGYGHTAGVKPGMKITQAEADALFEKDIIIYEDKVKNALKRNGITTKISQKQFDAMVNYTYNAGSLGGKFLSKLKKGDYIGASAELEVGGQNAQRMDRLQKAFREDVGSDNKLKADVKPLNMNEAAPTKDVKVDGLKGVKSTGKALTYDQNFSNITSHTKLDSGTNKYYDKDKGELGTFMGKTITSGIGKRSVTGGSSFHRGLDLGYASGTPVYSFTDGTVTYAAVMQGFGRLVIVTDSNKYQHLYGHLSKISVSNGKKVKKGDLLGYSGGSSTVKGKLVDNYFAPHLHYGIWRPGGTNDRGAYVDPRTYVYPGDEDTLSSNSKSANNKKAELNNQQLKDKSKEEKEKQKQIRAQNNNASSTIIKHNEPSNQSKALNINTVKINKPTKKKE